MLIILYLAAIIFANTTLAVFGPRMAIPNAFFFIGLDITTRDALHERWQHHRLFLKMVALILTGSVLSYVLNTASAQIAVASFVAFALNGVGDTVTYHMLKDHPRAVKINMSNAVSAAIDSAVFIPLAFGVILPQLMLLQFVAKVAGGFVWAFVLEKTAA